jgi:hypothetical protein
MPSLFRSFSPLSVVLSLLHAMGVQQQDIKFALRWTSDSFLHVPTETSLSIGLHGRCSSQLYPEYFYPRSGSHQLTITATGLIAESFPLAFSLRSSPLSILRALSTLFSFLPACVLPCLWLSPGYVPSLSRLPLPFPVLSPSHSFGHCHASRLHSSVRL